MKQFEYEITKHPADDFTNLVYFCTSEGECRFDQIPANQTEALVSIFDERGALGWELVQVFFGEEGVVAFWKRPT
jgi:hypothetical protein